MDAYSHKPSEILAAYARFFETLSADTIENLDTFSHSEMRFKDPFNDVVGTQSIKHILYQMLDNFRESQFFVDDISWSETGSIGYLRWTHTGWLRTLGKWHVEGVSEIHFSEDGRIAAHIDYWDAAGAFYERLPLIGLALRLIRRRLRV